MHSKIPGQLHESLAALAPPRRFELLLLLLTGVDRSVTQLAAAVRLSQSCTTRHLQALVRAGLARRLRDGKRVVFRAAPRDAAAKSVLASLAGASGPAREPGSGVPAGGSARPARSRPERRRDVPVPASSRPDRRAARSRVIRAPRPRPTLAPEVTLSAREPYSDLPISGDDVPGPRAAPESGRDAAPPNSPPRRWQELEDYLL